MYAKLEIIDKLSLEQLERLIDMLTEKKTRKEVNREYYNKHKEELRERSKKAYEAKKKSVVS